MNFSPVELLLTPALYLAHQHSTTANVNRVAQNPLWFQRKQNGRVVGMTPQGLLATFQFADLSISKKCVLHGGSRKPVVDPGEV